APPDRKVARLERAKAMTNRARLVVPFQLDSNVQPARAFGIVLRSVKPPIGGNTIENAQSSQRQ
ncbi:hypothetical protein BGZ99_006554, partial [Dissophora globulifera]